MTAAALTLTDIAESVVHMFGMDQALGIPLRRLTRVVMADPDVLVQYAEKAGLGDDQVQHARQVAHAITAGLSPETLDGRTWFLPGSVAPDAA